MACKYTAADAVKGLNQVFQQLLESTPQHAPGEGGREGVEVWGGGLASIRAAGLQPRPSPLPLHSVTCCPRAPHLAAQSPVSAEVMERWGTVLARPELQRYAEAATYLESAALKARSPLQAAMILNRCCAPALSPVPALLPPASCLCCRCLVARQAMSVFALLLPVVSWQLPPSLPALTLQPPLPPCVLQGAGAADSDTSSASGTHSRLPCSLSCISSGGVQTGTLPSSTTPRGACGSGRG